MENRLILLSATAAAAVVFFFLSSTCLAVDDAGAELQTYIIHVEPPETSSLSDSDALEAWYRSFLPTATERSGESRMVYSYGAAMSGFAARLTGDELKAMERKEGFVRADPDRLLPLLTTHTPDFLGLHTGVGLWRESGLGEGVIIGVLDTGVIPGHPSFDGDGMQPPPSRWKGSCDLPADRSACNNKLIGARAFIRGEVSPVDDDGHGTHTASTAAGNFVNEVEVLGDYNYTAVGMAPRAHLAVYKVCTEEGCATTNVVAGLNAAIKDGVDVLSISINGPAGPFPSEKVAIAAFGAVKKGVFVSCAAGNSGPSYSSVSNEAPWILTVAASTTDRSIRATVKLGDGREFDGQSLFQPANFSSTMLPVILPLDMDMDCEDGSLDDIDVEGKLVICVADDDGIDKGSIVKNAGGAAMILINGERQGDTTYAEAHVLPASHVSYADGSNIMAYIKSTDKPTATIIFKGTTMGTSPAPSVAHFSSRGPNSASPGILKPDITGPGVNILAAYPSPSPDDDNAAFNVKSGTSMSTPHLSGIAALIKSARPDWSPAMIKSAIMTTSDIVGLDGKPIMDETMQPASFFAMGAGHVNPSRARDPGLVYDIGPEDYIPYLCGLGYTNEEVGYIVGRRIRCSEMKSISEYNLNYPSIMVTLKNRVAVTVDRTVTNVGAANSTYFAKVDTPAGVSVIIRPVRLQFSAVNEKKRFTVRFSRSSGGQLRSIWEGNLRWASYNHVVRSPIIVSFK